jgi:hypothetical protein
MLPLEADAAVTGNHLRSVANHPTAPNHACACGDGTMALHDNLDECEAPFPL